MDDNRGGGVRVLSADDAVALIPDQATVAITGSGGGLLEADELFAAVERRFLADGHPRELTLVHALGVGDRARRGTNAFAHKNLVRRVIGGHWAWSRPMQDLTANDAIEAYTLPAGVISQLLREIGAQRPGLITRIGLRSLADPRHGGGRFNAAAQEPVVELLELDGEEYLRYKPFAVDVGIIRGSAVDGDGNLTCAQEPAELDALAVAQAARASGGIVLAQAKRRSADPLDPRAVTVPAALIDVVCVAPRQWQTYESEYDPAYSGDAAAANGQLVRPTTPLRRLIAARAAAEVRDGDVINVGFGISSEVVDVLAAQGRLDRVELCIEQGLIGGTPVSGDLFGISRNPRAKLASTTQFELFAGGLLDRCFLGLAQVDAAGCVNVSSLGGRIIGPGGFIDISQPSPVAVFCGSFTTKGLDVAVVNGRLRINREGSIAKFVDRVEQITYSGPLAVTEGRRALYVTERAVFELSADGVELIEVAEGISIADDILPHMGFEPIIRAPRAMDRALVEQASRAASLPAPAS